MKWTERTNTAENLKNTTALMDLGSTRGLVQRYMTFGTPETHCSLLPSRWTLIRQ